MITIETTNLLLTINRNQLKSLRVEAEDEARALLANIWDTDATDLAHYYAVFFDKNRKTLGYDDSFITLSYSDHGYVIDPSEKIDIAEAKKQIEIDLEIINRESQWGSEDSIYFDQWWPNPTYDVEKNMLEFGVSLKDFHKKVFNRTLNRLILTRFGHILLNYSLSEEELNKERPLSYYQEKLDEVVAAITIEDSFSYQSIDRENDKPSKSRMINLILSSEIF